jgi:hypothetical protein
MSDVKQFPCNCGRSPTGFCVGLHAMTTEQYKAHLDQQKQKLNEESKPKLLTE